LTLWCQTATPVRISSTRRATVYLDSELHRALRVKAAETDRSVSDLVNAAVRQTLTADAEDLETFRARAKEPNLSFETVLQDLRRRGKL
jgi:plasmid stability protein